MDNFTVETGPIAGVTIEDSSSELTGGFDRRAVYTTDGSGLNFGGIPGAHSVAPDGTMWLTKGTFQSPNDPLPASITFDLEVNYNLDSLEVWNYNENLSVDLTARGANLVEILVASSVGGSFTSLGDFTFNKAPGVNNVDFGQVIDLSSFLAADNVRLVQFNIRSNHGGDNDFAGLSEVQIFGSFVPEPSTFLIWSLGVLGLIGCRGRRRK